MCRMRIGEVLGKMGKLSGHDIDEILHEQSSTGRRFGDIALTWGLVEPEHIWSAWCRQLQEGNQRVDLDELGIDAQAAARVPGEIAWRLHAMPVRLVDGQLVFAISDPLQIADFSPYEKLFDAHIRFVFAEAAQIESALRHSYPRPRQAV